MYAWFMDMHAYIHDHACVHAFVCTCIHMYKHPRTRTARAHMHTHTNSVQAYTYKYVHTDAHTPMSSKNPHTKAR